MSRRQFDHERLNVYHSSIRFVAIVTDLLEGVPKSLAIYDQLDRASTSIPLNIAEGSGKFTIPDRCRFFDNARGSALECAAALDVLVAKGIRTDASVESGKELLLNIVAMLVGLLKSIAPGRLQEDPLEYGSSTAE